MHAPWSSVAFLGNGFIPVIRLDITDHTSLMILISRLFAVHRRTSIAALLRTFGLILAVWDVAPSCIKTAPSQWCHFWLCFTVSLCLASAAHARNYQNNVCVSLSLYIYITITLSLSYSLTLSHSLSFLPISRGFRSLCWTGALCWPHIQTSIYIHTHVNETRKHREHLFVFCNRQICNIPSTQAALVQDVKCAIYQVAHAWGYLKVQCCLLQQSRVGRKMKQVTGFHCSPHCQTPVPYAWASYQVAHALGTPVTFSRHRGLAIPTCITARASHTCRDACWDR